MIRISRTYSECTPESTEAGDHSDSGFIVKSAEYGFRELVNLLRDHPDASCYPARGDEFESYSTGWYVEDYCEGTDRCESVHYCRTNPPGNAKYWRKAAIAAGIVKGSK